MSEQENTESVKEIYAAFGRGDIASVLDHMADDVVWVLPGPPDIPTAGTHRGKEAVQAWFGAVGENLEFKALEPREFIAQGDTVVALIYGEATTRCNGRLISNDEAHVWTIKDGKVARQQSFQDTAAIAAAYRDE